MKFILIRLRIQQWRKPATGQIDSADLIATLTNLLDEAEYSIDLAAYDLEHHRVGEALAAAAERGVRVRVVTDNYNR